MATAIVLGASSGVGQAIAETLADEYKVVGFHRGNHDAAANALERDFRVEMHQADAGATYEDFTNAFSMFTEDSHDDVSVLVHSLSGAAIGQALTMMPERVERTFNSLAHSLVWWVRALHLNNYFAPKVRVIALSNPCPDFYLQGSGVIGAAKAALESYVRILAAELGDTGITVNCLRFSTVMTPALQKVMPTAGERLEALHKEIVPVGRMQTVDDVADLVYLLTKPEAGWLNGAIIDGTGGAPSMLMNQAFHPGGRK